jgi:hypothetical protein
MTSSVFTGIGRYAVWKRIMTGPEMRKDGSIRSWLGLWENSENKVEASPPLKALRARISEQSESIDTLLCRICTGGLPGQETGDWIKIAEIHFRQLWNKSSLQAGHVFLHELDIQPEAGRKAILTGFDPAFVGVLIEAGLEARREQILAEGDQAVTEREEESSRMKEEIATALEKVVAGNFSTEEIQALLQRGILLELRMLQPFVTRPRGWIPTPENALKELDDLESALEKKRLQLPERLAKARTHFTSIEKVWGEKILKGDKKNIAFHLRDLAKKLDGNSSYQRAKMAFLRDPEAHSGVRDEKIEMRDLLADTEERLMASVYSAHWGRADIRKRMDAIGQGKWAAHFIIESMRSKGERGERPLHDLSAMAYISTLPEIIRNTFNPAFVTLRQSLLEGMDSRGCAISAPTVNLLQALPRALAELSLADANVPAPWKFVSPNIEGLSASADDAYTKLLQHLEKFQCMGHYAVFLNVTDFRYKFAGSSKIHMHRLMALCRTNRIALFPVGLPLDLDFFAENDEFRTRFPLTSVSDEFTSPAHQMTVEIAAAGYDHIQLSSEAQDFIKKNEWAPTLFRAVEIALKHARESEISGVAAGDGAEDAMIVIRGEALQQAFLDAGTGTTNIVNDPEALAQRINLLPAGARERGHELLAAGISPHTTEALGNILSIPFDKFLADMIRPVDGSPGTPLQQALARFTYAMEKHGIHDPKLLEVFSLQVASWIVMEDLRQKASELKRAVEYRLAANPKDETAQKELATLDCHIRDMRRNTSYPLLVGPSEQTKAVSMAFIRACLETSGEDLGRLSDAHLENERAIVLNLSGKEDVADIFRGHSHTYVGSKISDYLRRSFKTGVANPYGALLDVNLSGQGIKDILLAILDPEQNREFRDDKLGFPVDVSTHRLLLTATSTKGLSEPFLSRVAVIRVTQPSEDQIVRHAVEHTLPALLRRIPGVSLEKPEETIRELLNGFTTTVDPQELERALQTLLEAGNKKYRDPQTTGAFVIHPGDVPGLLPPVSGGTAMKQLLEVGEIRFPTIRRGRGEFYALLTDIQEGSPSAPFHLDNITGLPKSSRLIKDSIGRSLHVAQHEASRWGVDADGLAGMKVNVDFNGVDSSEIPIDGDSLGVAGFLAFLSLLVRIPLRPEVTGTGALDIKGNVRRIEGIEEKIIAAQNSRRTTFFLPEVNRRDLENAIQESNSPQGLFLRASPQGLVAQLFLPSREPRPGASLSSRNEIDNWCTRKTALETAANEQRLARRRSSHGSVIEGTPEQIGKFADAHDFPLPMTYLIFNRADDALSFREALFPPSSSPSRASHPHQRQSI